MMGNTDYLKKFGDITTFHYDHVKEVKHTNVQDNDRLQYQANIDAAKAFMTKEQYTNDDLKIGFNNDGNIVMTIDDLEVAKIVDDCLYINDMGFFNNKIRTRFNVLLKTLNSSKGIISINKEWFIKDFDTLMCEPWERYSWNCIDRIKKDEQSS